METTTLCFWRSRAALSFLSCLEGACWDKSVPGEELTESSDAAGGRGLYGRSRLGSGLVRSAKGAQRAIPTRRCFTASSTRLRRHLTARLLGWTPHRRESIEGVRTWFGSPLHSRSTALEEISTASVSWSCWALRCSTLSRVPRLVVSHQTCARSSLARFFWRSTFFTKSVESFISVRPARTSVRCCADPPRFRPQRVQGPPLPPNAGASFSSPPRYMVPLPFRATPLSICYRRTSTDPR